MRRYLMTTWVVLAFLAVPVFGAQVSIGVQIGAPPAPRIERVHPVQPGRNYVWVEGYWYPVGNHWNWHKGYWTRAPYDGAHWMAPRYEGGHYHGGYWEGEHGRIEHNHDWDNHRERDYRDHEHGRRDQ